MSDRNGLDVPSWPFVFRVAMLPVVVVSLLLAAMVESFRLLYYDGLRAVWAEWRVCFLPEVWRTVRLIWRGRSKTKKL